MVLLDTIVPLAFGEGRIVIVKGFLIFNLGCASLLGKPVAG